MGVLTLRPSPGLDHLPAASSINHVWLSKLKAGDDEAHGLGIWFSLQGWCGAIRGLLKTENSCLTPRPVPRPPASMSTAMNSGRDGASWRQKGPEKQGPLWLSQPRALSVPCPPAFLAMIGLQCHMSPSCPPTPTIQSCQPLLRASHHQDLDLP